MTDDRCSTANSKNARFPERRVLVVDDEPAMALVVEQIIKVRLGCQVARAGNGDEALRVLAAEPYDVLVTDMVMPGLHGLELVARVREQWPDTHIIVMTGFPDDFPYVEVIDAGANDFIGKPHPPAELEAKLRRIFKERDLREAQMRAEAKYRSLFELSMSGMLVIEPASFEIIDANNAFCELSGRSRDELLGPSLFDLLGTAEKSRIEEGFGFFALGGQGTLGDLLLVRGDGKELSLDMSITFITTAVEKVVLLAFKDLTGRREVDRQLAEVAQTDELTGLGNMATFRKRLEWAVTRARREDFSVTLMAIDLDNFKACNDTYGHPTGDTVLAAVGDLIRNNVRADVDDGFRCGGDEFAVLLMGVQPAAAREVAGRMQAQYDQFENYGTSMCIGIAALGDGMGASDWRRTADEALYRAKELGKNTIHVAT